jgi:hypothetical protein
MTLAQRAAEYAPKTDTPLPLTDRLALRVLTCQMPRLFGLYQPYAGHPMWNVTHFIKGSALGLCPLMAVMNIQGSLML